MNDGRPPIHQRLHAWLLVAAMAFGSVAVWLVSPVAWLWIASRVQKSSEPSMGPYVLVMVGIIITTIALAKALGALNRAYVRITTGSEWSRQTPWLRSLRGDRASGGGGVLEVVMAISVGIALLVSAVWFFGFAGSSLPS